MGYDILVTHLEFYMFTSSPTFHHTSINDYNLKIVQWVNITMCLFYHSLVSEIVSTSTMNLCCLMYPISFKVCAIKILNKSCKDIRGYS